MLALRCCCQGAVGVIAVPMGGFVEGILDVVHEIQHVETRVRDGTIVQLRVDISE